MPTIGICLRIVIVGKRPDRIGAGGVSADFRHGGRLGRGGFTKRSQLFGFYFRFNGLGVHDGFEGLIDLSGLGGCGEVLQISHFFIEAKLVDEGLLSFGGVGELGEGAFSPVDFDSVDAFGLDFAELVDGAVEGVLGGGSGSFDEAELFFIQGVEEGVEGGAIGDVAV